MLWERVNVCVCFDHVLDSDRTLVCKAGTISRNPINEKFWEDKLSRSDGHASFRINVCTYMWFWTLVLFKLLEFQFEEGRLS